MATAREFGDDLLRKLLEHAVESTPGALGAGLVLGSPPIKAQGPAKGQARSRPSGAPDGDRPAEGNAYRVVAAVGVAAELDPEQVSSGVGPVLDAMTSGKVIADAMSFAGRDDVRGLVVTPGEWGGELPVVLTTYLDAPPDDDTTGTVDRWEGLLSQALAVVEYCAGEEVRAEQMLQMIQYRRVVEQAKGCLMAVTGADAQTAFSVLSRASQHFNVRLRTLAIALVEHVGAGEVEHPQDPDAVVQPSARDRQVAEQVWEAMRSGGKIGEGADGAVS